MSRTELIDLSGKTFGKMTVEKRVPKPETLRANATYWLCHCNCGASFVANGHGIRSGQTVSCKKCRHRFRTHGMTNSSEFASWKSMRDRCSLPTNDNWMLYGGRGITVCERWQNSFADFYADMGPKPAKGMSLDRIDPNKGYFPENCRWATTKQQMRNKRTNVLITIGGVAKPISEWAEIHGLSRSIVWHRLERGWSAEDSVKPVTPRSKKA